LSIGEGFLKEHTAAGISFIIEIIGNKKETYYRGQKKATQQRYGNEIRFLYYSTGFAGKRVDFIETMPVHFLHLLTGEYVQAWKMATPVQILSANAGIKFRRVLCFVTGIIL